MNRFERELAARHNTIRATICDSLLQDGSLKAALGGPKVYTPNPGHTPPFASGFDIFPYVTVGPVCETDDGFDAVLRVYSRGGGVRQAHEIAGAVLQSLDDLPPLIADRRVADCRSAQADIRREADGLTYCGIVRFQAVYDAQAESVA